jgi:GntR family transcriptional regulator, N-acetylglucosamine utilization regulator
MAGGRSRPSDRTLHVDRTSPVPLHVQVKQALTDRIGRRAWKPGDLVPGDVELCEQFGVSRTTVRQALAELAHEGWVTRERGRGTFVAPPKLTERAFERLSGFFEDMVALGHPPVSHVLRQQVGPADEAIAARLNVKPGTPIVQIERLRFVEDEPVVLTTTYLPKSLVPGLEKADLTRRSLYEYLETECGLSLERGQRTIEAVAADERCARLLRVRKGAPLVFLQSVSYLEDGRPIEYYLAHHRGDRSRFEVELVRGREPEAKGPSASHFGRLPPGGGTVRQKGGQ